MLKSFVKTVNFHLRNIYRIWSYITFESCPHLVRLLFLSRLDNANSLLFFLSAKDRKKLETLKNKAARIIFRGYRLEPSVPLLRELHWLSVNERVIYRVLLVTYKSVDKFAPAYLAELFKAYKPGYENLRSSKSAFLTFQGPIVSVVTILSVLLPPATGTHSRFTFGFASGSSLTHPIPRDQ